jgi:hypothetical protein
VHCKNNTHATEDIPYLIVNWEDRVRQQGANVINYKPINIANIKGPNINIVTKGGAKTCAEKKSPDQLKI